MLNPVLLAALESVPVVDVDNTAFLQGILFLILFLLLHFLLFKPWLELKHRRAERIGGAKTEAVALRERAVEVEADYAARLDKARDSAMELRSDRRRESEAEEAEIVGAARRDAAAELEANKVVLERQTEQARTELVARVDELAGTISARILGRSA